MPVANTGRLKSGISPNAVADVMAPTKPCILFIGCSFFLVDELTSVRVDKVIAGLVGLVDELTSLRVDKLIVGLVVLVDELTS